MNKRLLGIHSVNTTTALTEIPVGRAKPDFILINGKAVVYEIKTELTNIKLLYVNDERNYITGNLDVKMITKVRKHI